MSVSDNHANSEADRSGRAAAPSLRDRIAASVVLVIGDSLGSGTELGLDIADAVIAELKSPQPCRNCGCPLVRDWTNDD